MTPGEFARKLAMRDAEAGALLRAGAALAVHEYASAANEPIYWRARVKHDDGRKWIRPFRRDGDSFAMGEPKFPKGEKPLYGLQGLATAGAVYVVEGEAVADALAALGVIAVTSGGASSAGDADWQPLAGREAFLWPDNDEAGERYMAAVAEALLALGCRVLALSLEGLALPPKGDAVDWLAVTPGATAADLLALPWRPLEPLERRAPKPLPSELHAVPEFPLQALPGSLRPWVADVVERMNCPAEFVAVPLLVGAAMLTARTGVRLRVKALDDWSEGANLWALLVGRPGAMKSPAMREALAPLHRLEGLADSEFREAEREQALAKLKSELRNEALKKLARKRLTQNPDAALDEFHSEEAEPPTRRRYIARDASYEALGKVLAENPGGILVERDELRGWFHSLGREEHAEARAFALQGHSGGPYTFDRITRAGGTIPDVRLSILGGIQPGPLGALMAQARRGEASADGLLERFLIAWPDDRREWCDTDRKADREAREAAFAVFDRLDALTPEALGATQDYTRDGEPAGAPYVRLSDAALLLFNDYRRELHEAMLAADGTLEGALSKFRKQAPALALTIHAIEGETGPVSKNVAMRALALCGYFEAHARRLHDCAVSRVIRAAKAIVAKARAGSLAAEFTAREIKQKGWSDLADAETVADALDMLVEHGWLGEREHDSGGRPTMRYSLHE
jgi:hypothetical protein